MHEQFFGAYKASEIFLAFVNVDWILDAYQVPTIIPGAYKVSEIFLTFVNADCISGA